MKEWRKTVTETDLGEPRGFVATRSGCGSRHNFFRQPHLANCSELHNGGATWTSRHPFRSFRSSAANASEVKEARYSRGADAVKKLRPEAPRDDVGDFGYVDPHEVMQTTYCSSDPLKWLAPTVSSVQPLSNAFKARMLSGTRMQVPAARRISSW